MGVHSVGAISHAIGAQRISGVAFGGARLRLGAMSADGRGRGRGHHQRAAALLEDVRPSRLARHLKEEFCFGHSTAVDCQRIANFAVTDHSDSPEELKMLARLGTYGRNPQHVHDQLVTMVESELGTIPEPVEFPLSLRSNKREDGEEIEHNFIHYLIPIFI